MSKINMILEIRNRKSFDYEISELACHGIVPRVGELLEIGNNIAVKVEKVSHLIKKEIHHITLSGKRVITPPVDHPDFEISDTK